MVLFKDYVGIIGEAPADECRRSKGFEYSGLPASLAFRFQ